MLNVNDEYLIIFQHKFAHAVGVAQIAQTIDPGVHIAAVEIGETEYGGALVVKTVPVVNQSTVQACGGHVY